MMPRVRLLAGLREPLGAKQLASRAPSVRALLDELVTRAGAEGAALRGILEGPDLRVLVNGRSIQFLDGLDTPLADSDHVTLHLAGARGYPGG